jgi:hypothetical protein
MHDRRPCYRFFHSRSICAAEAFCRGLRGYVSLRRSEHLMLLAQTTAATAFMGLRRPHLLPLSKRRLGASVPSWLDTERRSVP